MAAAPAPAPTPRAQSSGSDIPLELGGGALALLALGGAAFALARRRRREEGWGHEPIDWAHEPAAEAQPEIHEQPAMHEQPVAEDQAVADAETAPIAAPRHDPVDVPAASAFAWGRTAPAEEPLVLTAGDRRPGESWTERAMRGPTPENPSLSLKKRLKRAAFFEQRERESAAGLKPPVEADAGLPEAAVEERQLETA